MRGPLLLRFFLRLLSFIYGGLVTIRSDLFSKNFFLSRSLPCKTISVGNLVLGGTGKTPFTVLLANLIKHHGLRVVVVTRGYGGRMEKKGCIASDGAGNIKNVRDIGDESYLVSQLLEDVPVVIGKNKFKAGIIAVKKFAPDVIIFDDAFQHRRVRCDLNLVLMDGLSPIGNGFIFPRGILREPLSALCRADAIIFTRVVDVGYYLGNISLRPKFLCAHKPVLRKIVSATTIVRSIDFKDKNVITVSGLANNSQFHETVKKLGFVLKGTINFEDHHNYNYDDLEKIKILVRQVRPEFIVTTDKDYTKIANRFIFPVTLLVFGVDIEFHSSELEFSQFISNFIFA